MRFSEFHDKYSGSMRNKNIKGSINNPIGKIRSSIRLASQLRLKDAFAEWAPRKNKRVWHKSMSSPLGRHFICLCPWEAAYLYAIACQSKTGILEIGRFNGGSTFLLGTATDGKVPIYSIDIAPQDDINLLKILEKYSSLKNINLHIEDSTKTELHKTINYDFLWIDGDHSYEGCLSDLRNFYPQLEKNGHLLLHDAYEGSEVLDAIFQFQRETPNLIPVNNVYKTSYYYQDPHGSIAHFIKS